MIKYNKEVCRNVKIFRFPFTPNQCTTHTRTHAHNLTRNYICSRIYQDVIRRHTTILCFIILIIHNFSQHNCKLPEDAASTLEHVGMILL